MYFNNYFNVITYKAFTINYIPPRQNEADDGAMYTSASYALLNADFNFLFETQLSRSNLPPPRRLSAVSLKVITAVYYVNQALINIALILKG